MSFRNSIAELKTTLQNWATPDLPGRLGICGLRQSSAQRERRAIVVAPASPGSLGDEAMLCALAASLRASGIQEIIVATWRQEDDWQGIGGPVSQELLPQGDSAGKLRFTQRLRTAAALYVIGADVIDGAYSVEHSKVMLAAADMGIRHGLRTTIIGCSFCDRPNAQVVESLKQLDPRVTMLMRDCYSQKRMEEATGRNFPLVADIAFLLKPAIESARVAKVADWIARQRRSCGLVIGCNLNPQPLISGSCEPALLLSAYVEAFKQWLDHFKPGFGAVILPHDYRPKHRELEICEAFHAMLPAALKEKVLLVHEPLRAAEARAITAHCDLTLTGRMHLAVAALGSARPVACLGYQAKFEGLLAHFGLEDLVLPWRDALAPGQLAKWGGGILSRRVELTGQVAAKLPGVIKLSQANLHANRTAREVKSLFPMPRHAHPVT